MFVVAAAWLVCVIVVDSAAVVVTAVDMITDDTTAELEGIGVVSEGKSVMVGSGLPGPEHFPLPIQLEPAGQYLSSLNASISIHSATIMWNQGGTYEQHCAPFKG